MQLRINERHFLCRAKKNLKQEIIKKLGPGDTLVSLQISRKARKEDPTLPKTIIIRAIQYQIDGYLPQTLFTSLLDSDKYKSKQIISLYHERWEIELGYDEIKTHTLEREESMLCSKAPERVSQELWGVLIAYNLVRKKMEQFAEKKEIEPLRISYRATLLIVRNTILSASYGGGSVRKLLQSMDKELDLLLLPPRRQRQFERHVKIRVAGYKKNPGRRTIPHA